MFPHGDGRVGAARVRHALQTIATHAWSASKAYHLGGLLDMEQALMQINIRLEQDGRKPITARRLRAIAADRHQRWAVGRQVARGVWIFAPDELEHLMPNERGERIEQRKAETRY